MHSRGKVPASEHFDNRWEVLGQGTGKLLGMEGYRVKPSRKESEPP